MLRNHKEGVGGEYAIWKMEPLVICLFCLNEIDNATLILLLEYPLSQVQSALA